jgi:hypothetical protein
MSSLDKINVLVPNGTHNIENIMGTYTNTIEPFNEIVIEFVDAFSKLLLTDVKFKNFPEIVALGFWMRKASIRKLKNYFLNRNISKLKVSRGLIFHIAPSNVDTIFIYSLIISVLLGNRNIVRVSGKESVQKDLIVGSLNTLFECEKFTEIKKSIALVGYEHNSDINKYFASHCDVRIIWGGDITISTICEAPVSPRSFDIKFANKYSIAVLSTDALELISDDELSVLAQKFVNDSYSFGQKACSSPRTVYWIGDKVSQEKRFWRAVHIRLQVFEHELTDADFINKYTYTCCHAIEHRSKTRDMKGDNLVSCIMATVESSIDISEHCGSGLFIEARIDSLTDLIPKISRSIQTLSYFGIESTDFSAWLSKGVNGIDRVVPIGRALDFDIIWDGVDLTESLTREITIK